MPIKAPVKFIIAEDDEDDQLLIREALDSSGVLNPYVFVNDGVELLEYLKGEDPADPESRLRTPTIILLDLNMPRMDGREALQKIKSDPDLKKIPVVILTTSKAQEDIIRSYETGVNSFITKPVTFEGLIKVIRQFQKYWLEIVELPEG